MPGLSIVGTGKRSGAPVEHEIGVAYTLRNGKLLRLRSYANPAEALQAVGLRE
jgi:ketosteroid isomerase-like protein